MGDILPNQNSFRFNKKVVGKGSKVKRDPVELGNVTKKVTMLLCPYSMHISLVNVMSIQTIR